MNLTVYNNNCLVDLSIYEFVNTLMMMMMIYYSVVEIREGFGLKRNQCDFHDRINTENGFNAL